MLPLLCMSNLSKLGCIHDFHDVLNAAHFLINLSLDILEDVDALVIDIIVNDICLTK